MNVEGGKGAEQTPFRTHPTPVFLCALALWASSAASYTVAETCECGLCVVVASSSVLIGIALSAVGVKRKGMLSAFALSGAFLGLSLGFGYGAFLHVKADTLEYGVAHEASIVLLEDAKDTERGERALVLLRENVAGDTVALATVESDSELRFGDELQSRCTLERVTDTSARYCWGRGACCTVSVEGGDAMRPAGLPGLLLSVRNKAIDSIGSQGESHSLLQALVCGYRRGIRDSPSYADFQTCGLAHLIAVSGAHLVIVTGILATVLRALRVPRRFSTGILAASMGAYLVVAGMPVSALRAVTMASLGLLSYFGKRRPSSLNALGIGIIGIVCANPPACVSASFVLSGLSTMGIVMFAPLIRHIISKAPVGRIPMVVDSLALTLSAGMLSQLYASSMFGVLPLVSPVANMICAPVMPLACGFGLAASIASCAGIAVSGLLLDAAGFFAGALLWLVTLMADVPHASIPFSVNGVVAIGGTAMAAAVLWLLWPTELKRWGGLAAALAAAVCVFALYPREACDSITMLDVGQGDSFLVESRGKSLLVDTGNQDRMLLESLFSLRVAHVDSVLITHADDDHCGSLDALGKAVDIDRVLLAADMMTCGDESCQNLVAQASSVAGEVVGLSYGDVFSVGDIDAEVVWPKEFADAGGNADSVCIVLRCDCDGDGSCDVKALFTGDAEKDEIASMIASGDIGDVDILKVGHHGSRNGMTEEECSLLDPEIALIGVGKGNRYGHPTQEILSMLDQAGSAVYRSDRDGDVTCSLAPDSVTVKHVGLEWTYGWPG